MGRALAEASIVRLASAVPYASIQTLLDQLGGAEGNASEGAKKKSPPPPASRPVDRPAGRAGVGSPHSLPRRSDRPAGRTPDSGQGRASPPPALPAVGMTASPSREDVRTATAEPMVRQALELFAGSLVNVERTRQEVRSED